MVKFYLGLKYEIDLLIEQSRGVSDRYIREHSLTGSGLSNAENEDYQRAPTVFNAVADILAIENNISKNIARKKKRYELFTQEFTLAEIQSLENNLFYNIALLNRACEQVGEVEYYLTCHAEIDNSYLDEFKQYEEAESLVNELAELFGGD